ncbi:type II secretion system minor pseudopilin GspK [Desulforhopalus sp. 52FAK]
MERPKLLCIKRLSAGGFTTRGDERGMALLITIMTLSLLAAVTIQYHKVTWHKLIVSDNYKRGLQLKSITESGINIALATLQSDLGENISDSLLDPWAQLEEENFDALFPAGELRLTIADLSGKLQVNSLVETENSGTKAENSGKSDDLRTILKNILLSEQFRIEDETEVTEIIDAIVDWIDDDDKESDHGAETSYYQALDEPYAAKNGLIYNLEELLLVRGITPEIFYGTKESKGLRDLLTVYGDDGKININTADPLIVQAMNPLITDSLVEQFDEYRRDSDNSSNLSDTGWYVNIGWPGDIELDTDLLTTESHYFQIFATGRFDTLTWTMVADAERTEEGTLDILRKKVE